MTLCNQIYSRSSSSGIGGPEGPIVNQLVSFKFPGRPKTWSVLRLHRLTDRNRDPWELWCSRHVERCHGSRAQHDLRCSEKDTEGVTDGRTPEFGGRFR